jgi:NaMN:DMB phosphoribosyltransferase
MIFWQVCQAGAQRANLLVRKVAGGEQGTADSSRQPAMTSAQCQQALQNGQDIVKGLPGNALLLGEMGIGNTSAASLLLARLAGLDIEVCTGAGTGLDALAVQRKTAVLREVLARHPEAKTPLDALAAFGGFEIATMVGAVMQAAHERRVVVVDGFIATSAVLVAYAHCSRWCCSVVFSRTARASVATSSCCSTWACRRCWTWACVWERAPAGAGLAAADVSLHHSAGHGEFRVGWRIRKIGWSNQPGLGHFHPVAAVGLGPVHGRVGPCQQRIHRVAAGLVGCDANAHGRAGAVCHR